MKKLKEKKYVLLNIMSIVAFLLFWQGFSIYNQTAEIMNPKYLPGPIEVVQTVLNTYLIKEHCSSTYGQAFTEYLADFYWFGSAVAVGYICSKSKIISNILDPIFNIFGPIPAYAFMPLFIILVRYR